MNAKRPGWQTCAHQGTFDEHCCWAITNPDLRDEQTEEKFCPAKVDGVIRRFGHRLMGYMEAKQNDWMITKFCKGCNQPVLLRLEDDTCKLCKEREETEKPILAQ